MIDVDTVISYSQYNEDLILLALLYDVKGGFYVDVGANYPEVDSVTKLFYDKGWRGINIEPIESLYKQLVRSRPRDINLQCGAGSSLDNIIFREYTKIPGHSTFDSEQKQVEDENLSHKDYKVAVKTLAEIFTKQKVSHIDFLKIDVEGFEYDVVLGNDWSKYRPEVICIEANHISKDWKSILLKNRYKLFIFDGLNEYYVAKESWSRTEGFAERATNIYSHTIQARHYKNWLLDIKNLNYHVKLATDLNKQNEELQQRLVRISELSLKDKGLLGRIKCSAYGLTIDWYRFKKATSKKLPS